MPCQIYQFFCLGRRGCQRLFHNNMFACFQRHAGIAHMLQVRHCNVHHIHPLQQFQKIGGVLRHAVLAAKALSQLGAALGAADGLHRKGVCSASHGKNSRTILPVPRMPNFI